MGGRREWSRNVMGAAIGAGLSAAASGGIKRAWADPARTRPRNGARTNSLSLELVPRPVGINEVAYLEAKVQIHGQGADVEVPVITAPKGVKVRVLHRSQSQMTRIINGNVSVETSFDYTFELSAARAGVYAIGGRVKVNDQWVTASKRVRLTVQQGAVQQGADRSAVAKEGDPVMIVPHITPKGPLYVGQMALYQLELWTRTADVPSSVERPKFQEFLTEDFPPPRRRLLNLRGHSYNVQSIYFRALFPQKAGDFEIPGIELEMSPSGFGSLFGRRRRRGPYRVKGPSTSVKVRELPQKGKPANFPVSHVGSFKIRSEVDRSDLKVNDALSLTVEISGQGNLRLVDPGPLPKIPGMRGYEPKREEPEYTVSNNKVRGSVRWRYLLIPSKAGTLTIPSIKLSYFDPDQERYLETKTSPITLDVKDASGSVPQAPAGTQGATEEPPEAAELEESAALDAAESMEFAALLPGDSLKDRISPSTPWLNPGRYWALLGAAPAIVGAYAGQTWLAARLGQPERVRRRKQKAELMALLKQARQGADEKGRWASLGQLLQRLALLRAGDEAQGLPRPQLVKAMQSAGLSSEQAQAWESWLDACDASRFGAGSSSAGSLEQGCEFAQVQIDALEKELA